MTQIDCVSYGDGNGSYCGSAPDVAAPSSGQTASRVPVGTGVWTLGVSTKSLILCESLVPTPTPIPSPAPTPTSTSTPTPSPTSIPTFAPTPANTPTPSPTKTAIPKPALLTKASPGSDGPSSEAKVLGIRKEMNDSTKGKDVAATSLETKGFPYVAVIFVALGVVLIGFSVYLLVRKAKEAI